MAVLFVVARVYNFLTMFVTFFRVTTCLENLDMSGILTAVVSEMSGILLKVREVSGKSCLKLFIVSCIFASILDFAEFVRFLFSFRSLFRVAFLPPAVTMTLVPA